MNNFFYDLNKRLANLASKQDAKQISEDAKATAPKSRLAESMDMAEAGNASFEGTFDLMDAAKDFAKKWIKRYPGNPNETEAKHPDEYEKFANAWVTNVLNKNGIEVTPVKLEKSRSDFDYYLKQEYDMLSESKTKSYSAKNAAAGKDIGKPGKNFAKIAKGAAKRYGSKEAGERVAGAVLNKLRHPKEDIEQEGVVDTLKKAVGLGPKTPGLSNVPPAALRGMGPRRFSTPPANKTFPAGTDIDLESIEQEGNAFTGALAKTPKGQNFALGGKKFKDTSSIEEAGFGNDLRDHVLAVLETIYKGAVAGEEMIDDVADELGDHFTAVKRSGDKTLKQAYSLMRDEGQEAEGNPQLMASIAKKAIGMLSSIEEVGKAPMTTKQKSFAKLAPPADKITFADKIAGAKKEVDEMLGDVAADAMRKAITSRGGEVSKTSKGITHRSTNAYGGTKDEPADNLGKLNKSRIAGLEKGMGVKFGKKNREVDPELEVDEGFADMDAWLASREKEKGTGRFDKRKVSTGTVYTRKPETFASDDDEEVSTEPKRRGRPKGKDKGPERVTAKSYKYKAGRPTKTAEDIDVDGVMMTRPTNCSMEDIEHKSNPKVKAWNGLMAIVARGQGMEPAVLKHLKQIARTLKPEELELDEEKVEAGKREFFDRLAPAAKKATKVIKAMAKNRTPVEEESTDKKDTKAEKAGKKVAKDIEHDEGHKAKDDNRAEKAGKKVTKDIEYDDKKDAKEKKDNKEEKVEETTVAGSVATATPSGKSSKGGMSFGKGVYEGFNTSVERMITETMNVTVNMNAGEDGETRKSITVSAEGEEADQLAALLKMAGLHGQSSESCNTCGQAPCGCEQTVDEAYGDTDETLNKPDWPTDTETLEAEPNLRTYSGGLNGPKSTGQTTVPVVASQLRRQVSMEESLELERNLFKTWKNYKG